MEEAGKTEDMERLDRLFGKAARRPRHTVESFLFVFVEWSAKRREEHQSYRHYIAVSENCSTNHTIESFQFCFGILDRRREAGREPAISPYLRILEEVLDERTMSKASLFW